MLRWKSWPVWLLAAVSLAIFFAFGAAAYHDGQFVAPVDDAYIHFQYAHQAASGQVWRYNSGDPPTTGATSVIYPFLLAAGFLLGLAREQIALLALGIGFCSFLGTGILFWVLLRDWFLAEGIGAEWAALPMLLLMGTGAIQWGFFNGMETGLFCLVLAAALLAFSRRRWLLFAFFAGLSAWVRPEGTFLAAAASVQLLLMKDVWRSPRGWRTPLVIAALFSLAAAPQIANWWVTGDFASTGAQAKSWFANVPFRPIDIATSVWLEVRRILARVTLGLFARPTWPVLPGVLPLAIVGWLHLMRKGRRPLALLTFCWSAIILLLSATLITAIWHVGRYQVPALIVLFPPVVVGGSALLQRLSARYRPVGAGLMLIMLLLTLWTSLQAHRSYAAATRSMAGLQIPLALWIDQNLPDDAVVAILDAGALRFFGNRPTVDVIGLTTPGFAPLWREGMGAVFERLETLPRRPTHFAVFPNVSGVPYFEGTDLFAREVMRVTLPSFSAIGAVEGTKVLYEIDWRRANRENEISEAPQAKLVATLRGVGRIDVADTNSEATSAFSWWEGPLKRGHATELFQFPIAGVDAPLLLDGGRLLTGGVAFDVAAQPGEPLVLVARTHNLQPNGFTVAIDGRDAGLWRQPTRPGEWVESSYIIDGAYVTRSDARVTLQLVDASAPAGLFHLWIFSGRPNFQPFSAAMPLQVTFAGGIQLLGYSLEARAGELRVTLGWLSPSGNDVDDKTFVHLYDASGAIVAQADSYAGDGTRPPFTWHPGEPVVDTYVLPLPAGASPAEFELAVGLYDPLDGARLPILDDGGLRVANERLFLTATAP